MYWIEEVNANHMDTVLIPHIIEAHAQKGKTEIKRRQRVQMGSPRICEVEGSIVIV